MRWHEADVLRVTVIGGATAAAVLALLLAKPFYSAMADSKARTGSDVSQPVANQGPVTEAISFVTSPTIEKNCEFFYGAGDGSAGYYAERPEARLMLVSYERMP